MTCYYQGCSERGCTREHVPPKAFFPRDQRRQLFTVRSCEKHNNEKSSDDLYVLAQICLSASPANGAREIFIQRVKPQLEFNGGALRKRLAAGAVTQEDGSVAYPVDVDRMDSFFTALSFAMVYKVTGRQLPPEYSTKHIYHQLRSDSTTAERAAIINGLEQFYSGKPMAILDFGQLKSENTPIYSVRIFGISGYISSITVRHEFFGCFKQPFQHVFAQGFHEGSSAPS